MTSPARRRACADPADLLAAFPACLFPAEAMAEGKACVFYGGKSRLVSLLNQPPGFIEPLPLKAELSRCRVSRGEQL